MLELISGWQGAELLRSSGTAYLLAAARVAARPSRAGLRKSNLFDARCRKEPCSDPLPRGLLAAPAAAFEPLANNPPHQFRPRRQIFNLTPRVVEISDHLARHADHHWLRVGDRPSNFFLVAHNKSFVTQVDFTITRLHNK